MFKEDRYINVLNTAENSLNDYQIDEIGKMAIISSILKNEFKEWIFCGFYRAVKKELLEIGPYQGNIIPCGIVDKKVTSLQKELGKEMDMEEVKNKLKTHLVRLFEIEIM